MSRKGLRDIPVELLLHILRHLEFRELVLSRATCRTLRDIINASLELQYAIELAVDNMVDGPRTPGSLSTAARLNLLLDRRRRWRHLDWVRKDTISLPGTCQAYEMVGGVFAKSMGLGDGWVGSRHLIMTWLPNRWKEAHSIVREDLGIASRDFAIDPTQDLIALVDMDDSTGYMNLKVRLHLRTMSRNTTHPLAAHPILSAPIPVLMGGCFVQIVNDVIGMFFWVHGPGYVVWNWRTGERILHRSGVELPFGTSDFAFISSRAFILASTADTGSIEVYAFNGRSESPIHFASLRLPPLRVGQDIHDFTTHTAPFLANSVSLDAPFSPSHDERIHAMTIQYGERGPRILLLVKNSYFLKFIPSNVELLTGQRKVEKVTLQWEEWGPRNTRFVEATIRSSWLRYVHAQRIVLTGWRPVLRDENPMQTVTMMDFNVHPKRVDDPCSVRPPARSIPAQSQGAVATSSDTSLGEHVSLGTYELVLDPSVVSRGEIFAEDVITHLPYSRSTREFSTYYSGFMIDDERLVGMKQVAFAPSNLLTDRDLDTYVF